MMFKKIHLVGLDTMLNAVEHMNFFEGRATEYSKASTQGPCISICKTDPVTGFCYGCGRNNEEKKTWKNENTTVEWKEKKSHRNQKPIKRLAIKKF